MLKKVVNRETILYTIFGVGTSLLNVLLFKALIMCELNYKNANLVTLIVVKLVAYVCNKNFVFNSTTANFKELCKEFGRFVIARGATMVVDYFGLIVMVELLYVDKMLSKCMITVFVVVINYFIGKKHVFINRSQKG